MTIGNIPKRLNVHYPDPSKVDCIKYGGILAFAVDVKNSKMNNLASRWAAGWRVEEKISEIDNEFVDLKVVAMDERCNGGRAWKVISKGGFVFDLREDMLLEVIKNGTIKKGVLSGTFVFAQIGSQMKLVLKGSQLYKEISESMKKKGLSVANEDLEFKEA